MYEAEEEDEDDDEEEDFFDAQPAAAKPKKDEPYTDIAFRSQCRFFQYLEVIVVFHEAVRHGDVDLVRHSLRQMPVLFWGSGSNNYGPEIRYCNWLLHKYVCSKKLQEAFLRSGLIRCTTSGSMYKAADLHGEHQNAAYAYDIKHNKNSTRDFDHTIGRLALCSNQLAIIRKAFEGQFAKPNKGTHTRTMPIVDVVSLTLKLFQEGVFCRKTQAAQGEEEEPIFDGCDYLMDGQNALLEKLDAWNEVVPLQDEEKVPGLVPGVMEDNEQLDINYAEEGGRLYAENEGGNFLDLD